MSLWGIQDRETRLGEDPHTEIPLLEDGVTKKLNNQNRLFFLSLKIFVTLKDEKIWILEVIGLN